MKKYNLIPLVFFSIMLSGCTSLAPNTNNLVDTGTPTMSLQQRQQQLSALTAWNLQGAIGIQQDTKHWSASISWQQQTTSNYKIRLYGPFGAGAIQLTGQPQLATLVSNNNPKPVTASNPEALIAKETGWQLPISDLYYWVRGLPAPGANQATFDNQHHLSQLKQDGWQVQYLDYQSIKGIDLPTKIGLNNINFKIKLVIKQWQFS